MLKTIFLTAAVALSGQALAVNKCTGPDGKVTFQDAPCEGKGQAVTVRPASGHAPIQHTNADGSDPPAQTETERINGKIEEMQRKRKLLELENVTIPQARAALSTHQARCEAQIGELRYRKTFANNNLAGATLENAIAGEMSAVAILCETKAKTLGDRLESALARCRALGGCQ